MTSIKRRGFFGTIAALFAGAKAAESAPAGLVEEGPQTAPEKVTEADVTVPEKLRCFLCNKPWDGIVAMENGLRIYYSGGDLTGLVVDEGPGGPWPYVTKYKGPTARYLHGDPSHPRLKPEKPCTTPNCRGEAVVRPYYW